MRNIKLPSGKYFVVEKIRWKTTGYKLPSNLTEDDLLFLRNYSACCSVMNTKAHIYEEIENRSILRRLIDLFV